MKRFFNNESGKIREYVTFGWSSIFHPVSQLLEKHNGGNPNIQCPRQYPVLQPVFAFSIGDRSYIAAAEDMKKGGTTKWCTANAMSFKSEVLPDVLPLPEISGVESASSVEYYGHYPIADAEYSFQTPVSMGVRASDGTGIFGGDYNQSGVLWGLPAAIAGGDLAAPCAPGGIVDAIKKAVQNCK